MNHLQSTRKTILKNTFVYCVNTITSHVSAVYLANPKRNSPFLGMVVKHPRTDKAEFYINEWNHVADFYSNAMSFESFDEAANYLVDSFLDWSPNK